MGRRTADGKLQGELSWYKLFRNVGLITPHYLKTAKPLEQLDEGVLLFLEEAPSPYHSQYNRFPDRLFLSPEALQLVNTKDNRDKFNRKLGELVEMPVLVKLSGESDMKDNWQEYILAGGPSSARRFLSAEAGRDISELLAQMSKTGKVAVGGRIEAFKYEHANLCVFAVGPAPQGKELLSLWASEVGMNAEDFEIFISYGRYAALAGDQKKQQAWSRYGRELKILELMYECGVRLDSSLDAPSPQNSEGFVAWYLGVLVERVWYKTLAREAAIQALTTIHAEGLFGKPSAELNEFLDFIRQIDTVASIRKMAAVPAGGLRWTPLRDVPTISRIQFWRTLLNREKTDLPFETAEARAGFSLAVCGLERGSCRVDGRWALSSNPLANQVKFDVVQLMLLSEITSGQPPVLQAETFRRWLLGEYTEKERKEIKGNALFDQSEDLLKDLLQALEILGGVRATTSPTRPVGPIVDPTIRLDDA